VIELLIIAGLIGMIWLAKKIRARPRQGALFGIRAHRSKHSVFGEGWSWVRSQGRGVILYASYDEALEKVTDLKRHLRSPNVTYFVAEYHYEA